MRAYAEGFAIMQAKQDLNLKIGDIAEIWRCGSGVCSWLLDLTARALGEDEELTGIKAWVPDSGEGRWTVFEADDLDVAAPCHIRPICYRFLALKRPIEIEGDHNYLPPL